MPTRIDGVASGGGSSPPVTSSTAFDVDLVAAPTADRTVTFPDRDGTVMLNTSRIGSLLGTEGTEAVRMTQAGGASSFPSITSTGGSDLLVEILSGESHVGVEVRPKGQGGVRIRALELPSYTVASLPFGAPGRVILVTDAAYGGGTGAQCTYYAGAWRTPDGAVVTT